MKFFTVVNEEGEITFPEELLIQEDWRVGDELSLKIEGDTIIIRNTSKEARERKSTS